MLGWAPLTFVQAKTDEFAVWLQAWAKWAADFSFLNKSEECGVGGQQICWARSNNQLYLVISQVTKSFSEMGDKFREWDQQHIVMKRHAIFDSSGFEIAGNRRQNSRSKYGHY